MALPYPKPVEGLTVVCGVISCHLLHICSSPNGLCHVPVAMQYILVDGFKKLNHNLQSCLRYDAKQAILHVILLRGWGATSHAQMTLRSLLFLHGRSNIRRIGMVIGTSAERAECGEPLTVSCPSKGAHSLTRLATFVGSLVRDRETRLFNRLLRVPPATTERFILQAANSPCTGPARTWFLCKTWCLCTRVFV